MKKSIRFWRLLVLVLVFPAALGARETIPGVDGFLFGICQGNEATIPYLVALGVKWSRVNANWRELTPEVTNPGLTLAQVKSDRALVEEFSRTADWRGLDRRIKLLVEHGIQPIPIIGHGYSSQLPSFRGKLATPDRLGQDHYLALTYLYVAAVVERYDGDGLMDAPGVRIKLWQIENEPNQAGLTAGWGWRDPKWIPGLLSAWSDWEFMTQLIQTLNQAVKDSDPESLTMVNFHTDVPAKITRLLNQPAWLDAVREWSPYIDVIGFDSYPNYYSPDPVRGNEVGEKVKQIRSLGLNKPVLIVETDYPSGPSVRGFSAEKQAEFIRQSFWSAYDAGAAGYIKFDMQTLDSHTTDITPKDLAALDRVIPMWEKDQLGRLLLWALPRAGYVQKHFLDVVKTVEPYWGLVTPSGEKKPGYFVIEEIRKELAQKQKREKSEQTGGIK